MAVPTQRNTLDDLIQKAQPKSFSEYEKLLDLANKFGEQAVKNHLSSLQNKQGVEQLLRNGLKNIRSSLNGAVEELFKQAKQAFELEHTPRAIPALQNKLNQELAPVQQQKQGFKPSPWLKNLDEAADPKVRDATISNAAQLIANNPNAQTITHQFQNVLKAEAEYRLALKMRAAPRPKPSAKARPEPR